LQTIVPVAQLLMPLAQGFGLVAQAWFAVHAPQLPLPSQVMLVPQLVPPILLLPSTQVIAPVAQEVTPFLQTLGLVVHAPPAVQATHAPAPLQTRLVPQLVPAALLPPSTQVVVPVAQEMRPFLQMLGLLAQAVPGVQSPPQRPLPSQNRLVPQSAPAGLLGPSTQSWTPVAHDVTPVLQAFGLLMQAAPGVQATQVPVPLQTRLVPQLVPAGLLPPSTQVIAPDAQTVAPFLQTFGLPVHAWPAVHDTHAPLPSQTRLLPQLVPAVFGAPLTHVALPVVHDATPL
jgi:hypothetical protein